MTGRFYRIVFSCSLGTWLFDLSSSGNEIASPPNSPFLPVGAAAVKSSGPVPSLELRGIMQMSQGLWFSIHDPVKKSAHWVALNEGSSGYLLHDYRVVDGEEQVAVDHEGRTQILVFREPKIAAGAMIAARMASPPAGPSAQNFFGISLAQVLPQEEGRLEILAAQVRSRLAREKQTGNPKPELLPAEEAQLKMLISQVRVRLAREKAGENMVQPRAVTLPIREP